MPKTTVKIVHKYDCKLCKSSTKTHYCLDVHFDTRKHIAYVVEEIESNRNTEGITDATNQTICNPNRFYWQTCDFSICRALALDLGPSSIVDEIYEKYEIRDFLIRKEKFWRKIFSFFLLRFSWMGIRNTKHFVFRRISLSETKYEILVFCIFVFFVFFVYDGRRPLVRHIWVKLGVEKWIKVQKRKVDKSTKKKSG